jgi:hypothetical protein
MNPVDRAQESAFEPLDQHGKGADVANFLAILEDLKSKDDCRQSMHPQPEAASKSAAASRSMAGADASLRAANRELQDEIARLLCAKRNADRDLFEVRALLANAEKRNDKLRATISFRLGQAMIEAGRSWHGAIAFPSAALGLAREARQRRRAAARAPALEVTPKPARQIQIIETALAIVRDKGPDEAAAWAKMRRLQKPVLARVLVDIAGAARSGDPSRAASLAVEAIELDRTQYRVTHLAFAMADAGRLAEAATIIAGVHAARATLSASERRKIDRILGQTELCAASPQASLGDRRQPLTRRAPVILAALVERLRLRGEQLKPQVPVAVAQQVGELQAYIASAGSPSGMGLGSRASQRAS